MTIALVDSDIVAYRCAAASEDEPEDIAILRTDKLMRDIIDETSATGYLAFLSGKTNFRYDIYPEYKANRRDVVRPKHLEACRLFLIQEWNATVTDGYEADDALGIAQYQNLLAQKEWDILYG